MDRPRSIYRLVPDRHDTTLSLPKHQLCGSSCGRVRLHWSVLLVETLIATPLDSFVCTSQDLGLILLLRDSRAGS